MRSAGHVTRMGEVKNAYKILVGKPEGLIPLGMLGRRRENTLGGCGLDSSGSG
jgi:hypothetical protein